MVVPISGQGGAGPVAIIVAVSVMIASGAIGYAIAAAKDRGWVGFVLGLFLGPLGWLIVGIWRSSATDVRK